MQIRVAFKQDEGLQELKVDWKRENFFTIVSLRVPPRSIVESYECTDLPGVRN